MQEEHLAGALADALRHPLLSAHAERRLAMRVARGDRCAREALVMSNLRLVHGVARSHRGRGAPLADLVQEGLCGLLVAVDKFDVQRGVRFSTYATWWIRATIGEALRRMQPVPLPRDLDARRRRVTVMAAQGTAPTEDHVAQLAELSGMTPEQVREAQAAQDLQTPIRLDRPLDGSDTTLRDLHEDRLAATPEEATQERLRQRDAQRLVDALPYREGEVLRQRFGLDGGDGRTLDQVASTLGLSRETVRQVELRLLASLARMPEAEPLRDAV